MAQIYDVLEEETKRVPFELLRSVALQFYSQRISASSLDSKISNFFIMMLTELDVLKDSHDESGQRYLEPTRSGKQLLQLVETLVEQKTQFSGTSAEVLLGSLNNLLTVGSGIRFDDAVAHHKSKIAEYKKDLERIQLQGVEYAELLPVSHSAEALFRQAEEAAVSLLVAIEDVKIAIEKKREDLAQSYFQRSKSAGSTIQAITEFYNVLYESKEYLSYIKAKDMLSFLPGYAARFSHKNIDKILFEAQQKELIPKDLVQRSNLKNFQSQFQFADQIIGEQIKYQIQLLQQQVFYAITSDLRGLHEEVRHILSCFFENKSEVFDFCEKSPLVVHLPFETDFGGVDLFDFERVQPLPLPEISDAILDSEEERNLYLSLLAAEEKTVQNVMDFLSEHLNRHSFLSMAEHDYRHGLIEYYVLSEVELFEATLQAELECHKNLVLKSSPSVSYTLKNVPCYRIKRKSS